MRNFFPTFFRHPRPWVSDDEAFNDRERHPGSHPQTDANQQATQSSTAKNGQKSGVARPCPEGAGDEVAISRRERPGEILTPSLSRLQGGARRARQVGSLSQVGTLVFARGGRPAKPVIALSALLVFAGLLLARPQAAHATIVERIVAVIGEEAILLTDVRERARPFLVRVYNQIPEGPQRSAAISQIYKVVLDRMVDEELEDRAADRAGIVVTSAEIDEALQRIARQNSMTTGQILAEAKRSGLKIEQYREELRRQVLQAKLGSLRLRGRVQISESDLQAAYARLAREERMQLPQRMMRIAIPLGNTTKEQARAKALAHQIVERARHGEDFRTLMKRYGSEAGSGLAESKPPAREPEPIQRASLALEVGDTSGPIRIGSNLIIFQLLERAPSSLPPYEEAREALHERVYMDKLSRVRERWLDGLRRRTHVELRM